MLAAEHALKPGKAGHAVLEKGWQLDRLSEVAAGSKHRAGQTKLANYARTRYERLRSEAALARVKGGGQARQEQPQELFPRELDEDEAAWVRFNDPLRMFSESLLMRDLARDKRAASGADPKALDRLLYELARLGFTQEAERIGEQITADDPIMAEWSDRLLAAESAVTGSEGQRRAALKHSWERDRWLEGITEAKYLAVQTKEANYLRLRYRRLAAELRLARVREKQPGN
jgi:hypothetical protein